MMIGSGVPFHNVLEGINRNLEEDMTESFDAITSISALDSSLPSSSFDAQFPVLPAPPTVFFGREQVVEQILEHVVSIPNPLEWGCFTFGVIQRDGEFSFFAAMDHVHGDATLIGTTMMEANGMYAALTESGELLQLPDAGSFDESCVNEREYTDTLTLDSPGVKAWIEFAENNRDGFPDFPLPLGNSNESLKSEWTSLPLMSPAQTERFESACSAAGARFVGGLFACLGLVEHELTGALTYYGLTPRDSRPPGGNRMTQGCRERCIADGIDPTTMRMYTVTLGDVSLTTPLVPFGCDDMRCVPWLTERCAVRAAVAHLPPGGRTPEHRDLCRPLGPNSSPHAHVGQRCDPLQERRRCVRLRWTHCGLQGQQHQRGRHDPRGFALRRWCGEWPSSYVLDPGFFCL